LNQNYPNLEYIIIDDNSIDGTIHMLRRYGRMYNLYWISEPDNTTRGYQ